MTAGGPRIDDVPIAAELSTRNYPLMAREISILTEVAYDEVDHLAARDHLPKTAAEFHFNFTHAAGMVELISQNCRAPTLLAYWEE